MHPSPGTERGVHIVSKFLNLSITKAGRNLLAAVHTGAVLIPTRIVIGSGYMPDGIQTADMTNVVSPVTELEISKARRTTDGTAIICGHYSNADITEDFYYRELSLFCRAEYRDAGGNVTGEIGECLYSYGNAGNDAELMPAYGDGQAVERLIDFSIYVGSSAQVSLAVASGIYVSVDDFNDYKAAITQALADKANATHNHDGEKIKPSAVDIFPDAGSIDGAYIDFHYNRNADDFTTRLRETSPGALAISEIQKVSGTSETVVNWNPILTSKSLIYLPVTIKFSGGIAYLPYPGLNGSPFIIANRVTSIPGEALAFSTSYVNGQIRVVTDPSVSGNIRVDLLVVNLKGSAV